MAEEKKVCCFFGHREISDAKDVRERLYKIVEELILHNNAGIFLFGSKSEFDSLCREVVGKLKEKYPYIHRIYIRAEYQYISSDYEKYLLQFCDETYYSKRATGGGRAVYVERNYEMIDKSDICIIYYKEGYLPPERKNERQPKSGTQIAYEYARIKKKNILNLFL